MKQHYTPLFYLRGFTDPVMRNPKKAKLWEFRHDRQTWEKARPKDVAWGEDFYAFTDSDGKKHDHADQGLQKLETLVSPSIRKLVCGRFRDLNELDLTNIATFAAHLRGRAPGFIDALVDGYGKDAQERMKRLSERFAADPADLKRTIAAAQAAGIDVPADMPAAALDPKHFRVTVNRASVAASALMVTSLDFQAILEKEWGFIEARPPEVFIVSDHPFFLDDERATLPISHSLCLQISHSRERQTGSKTVGFRRALDGEVKLINLRTAFMATRFVAGPVLGFPGADVLSKSYRRKPKNPDDQT